MKIWRTRIACGYLRLQTHTQNKYVILTAFPLQQCYSARLFTFSRKSHKDHFIECRDTLDGRKLGNFTTIVWVGFHDLLTLILI